MKKILLLLFVGSSMFACDEKEKKDENNKLDPNAMISIRPEKGVTRTEQELLSALEVVKQATNIEFWNEKIPTTNALVRTFGDSRDIEKVCLLMHGSDIIGQDGEYEPIFVEGRDVQIIKSVNGVRDTIAYIKNSTLRLAETQIKEAFAKEDYEACYKIFDEAFTFVPTTGKEWREQKDKNEN